MTYDIIIIGAGIVGLSTALKIKERNPDLKVAVLEKENRVSSHQSENNSGVIHAGIYYTPGSLKAADCTKGRIMLTEFCEKEDVPYELCGKLIVAATVEELPRLNRLWERGLRNGLVKMKKLSGNEIKKYEPHASGLAAIHVPYSGIVDYNEVSRKIAEIFYLRYGGEIFLNEKVKAISGRESNVDILTETSSFNSKLVINTAGLYSDKIAGLTNSGKDVRIIPFRGEYYKLSEAGKKLINNLIYPVPNPDFPFLGIHFTRMINGSVEAGPNAVWAFKREGYKKSSFKADEFFETISWPGFRKIALKYWKTGFDEYYRSFNKSAFVKTLQKLVPEITEKDLIKGRSGVRAMACNRNGELIDDFLIEENDLSINVLNAPSPAATAPFSIGDTIAKKAVSRLKVNEIAGFNIYEFIN